jgi:hypothetical protein
VERTSSKRSKENPSLKDQPQVALLMSDLSQAKELAQVFRETGVIPQVYEDLKDYWQGVLEDTPDFSVVDVKLMNQQGKLFLKNHPLIESGELNLSFFCSDKTRPLLYSTFDLFHYGVVYAEGPLSGQVKSLLKRFNSFQEIKNSYQGQQGKSKDFDQKLHRLVEMTEELKEKEFYQSLLKSIVSRFEGQRDADDFNQACSRVFETVKEVQGFTILELTPNAQKLTSAVVEHQKYFSLPSIWLGKSCPKGIEFFAQNMAGQVCLEMIGGELMSLQIRGKKEFPEIIIFIKCEDEEFLARFDWESLERYLSGLYSYFHVKNSNLDNGEKGVMQPWELFSFIDQIRFGKLPGSLVQGSEEDWALIDLNFSNLVDVIDQHPGLRFYWQSFYQDFFNRFASQKEVTFRAASLDIRHTALLVEKKDIDQAMKDLKTFSLRYPYWRFFEDVDVVLSKSMRPEIAMVPFSVEAYRLFLSGKSWWVNSKKEEKASDTSVYIEGPEENM